MFSDLQPYLNYLGIGLGAIAVLVLLVWLVAALDFMRRTRGLKKFILAFFDAIAINDIKRAYAQTTTQFQAQTTLNDFRKFVKRSKLNLYQTMEIPIPELDGKNSYRLDLLIELQSAHKIPLSLRICKGGTQQWALDALALTEDLSPTTTAERN